MDAIDTRYDSKQPVIHYLLSIDEADLSSFSIEMRLRNVPTTFQIAMVTHPEYDDRFWRYIRDLSVQTKAGTGTIIRLDSALWKVTIAGNEAVIRYRIQLPAPGEGQRPSWTPFLSSTGGLVGGPHSFMYVVGATLAPSHVTIKVPKNWKIATGLQPTSDPTTFFAASAFVLSDCPILTGKLFNWSFNVDGIPHHIVYWLSPGGKLFDADKLVESVRKLVEQAALLFGRLPYREYTFLLQDNSYGSLEHNNSVTAGISASNFDNYFVDYLGDIAHEYFHTWNLVRIHPVEYTDVSYKKQELSKGLWFSEGMTILYADLFIRKAGLPLEDSTRLLRLERLIRRYYYSSGNSRISPERVSMAEYGPQGMLGDYTASSHLQGELIGIMLDLMIRDVTNGKKSLDNVMRTMMERFSGEKGFTSRDIERVVADVSGLDVHSFFENYVRGNKVFDINKYLALIGIKYTLTWTEAVGQDKKPAPDLRLYSWMEDGETNLRIKVNDPTSCWGKAGLHTHDILISINGAAVNTEGTFNQVVRNLKMGDRVSMEVQRPTGRFKTTVVIASYKQPLVSIDKLPSTTKKQQGLYDDWSLNR